jgi:hypothetical protein
MHDLDRTQQYLEAGEYEFEHDREFDQEFESQDQGEFESEYESGDHEMEQESIENAEVDLASELLSVSNDQELDQFLGKFLKRAGRTFRRFARSGLGKGLAQGLRGIAKAALPTLGGVLGSAIPIPGVGTALGAAAGNMAAGALEFEGMSGEDREFEIARRVVRVGLDAAANLAAMPEGEATQDELIGTLLNAGRSHFPGIVGSVISKGALNAGGIPGIRFPMSGKPGGARTGRWVRRGNTIVLLGV